MDVGAQALPRTGRGVEEEVIILMIHDPILAFKHHNSVIKAAMDHLIGRGWALTEPLAGIRWLLIAEQKESK